MKLRRRQREEVEDEAARGEWSGRERTCLIEQ